MIQILNARTHHNHLSLKITTAATLLRGPERELLNQECDEEKSAPFFKSDRKMYNDNIQGLHKVFRWELLIVIISFYPRGILLRGIILSSCY